MTDIEKLKALLEGFGIRFFEGEDPKTENLFIRCKEGDEKVDGYALFFTDFEFDASGNFIKMGIWE